MKSSHGVFLVKTSFTLFEVKTEPAFACKVCVCDLEVIGEQNALLFPKITEEQSKAFISSFFPKYFHV